MKQFLFPVLMLCSLGMAAQHQPAISADKQFKLRTGADFLSYSNERNDFMLVGRVENTEKIYSLVMTDDADEIATVSNIRVATEVGDNHFRLAGLALAGSNLTAFVESHNPKTGRNVMAMQAVDKNGGLTSEGMLVGYFDFVKAENPGLWHIASSPDQKKIALVAQLPHQKGKPERFRYFFMDENLTMTNTGEFSISSPYGTAQDYAGLLLTDFLVSDKGDLYLVAAGAREDGHFPVVYKGLAGSDQCTAVPRGTFDRAYESGSYRAKIGPDGQLVLAGYFHKKAEAKGHMQPETGSWSFNTSLKTLHFNSFDKPEPGLRAECLVPGGGTFFLVGCSPAGIHVSGFDQSGARKFELPVDRNLMAGMSMHDHAAAAPKPEEGIACGMLDNQLRLFYNDLADKYKAGATGLVAVGLSVDGDGQAPEPVVYESVNTDGGMMMPQFFSVNPDHIRVLAAKEDAVRVFTFR